MLLKQYTIYVKTGDVQFAGTNANVYIKLYDSKGNKTKYFHLDKILRDDFERGHLDDFLLEDEADLCDISMIELWRDTSGLWDDWYVNYIQVQTEKSEETYSFPILKWIKAHHNYRITHLDTAIPQDAPYQEDRENELLEKQRMYELCQKVPDGPAQVSVAICASMLFNSADCPFVCVLYFCFIDILAHGVYIS